MVEAVALTVTPEAVILEVVSVTVGAALSMLFRSTEVLAVIVPIDTPE